MKIKVGSKNPAKVKAVEDTIKNYALFESSQVEGMAADSRVKEQPIGLEETIAGAKNRAQNAFVDCEYSFGLESGLIPIPETKTGYMDLTVCAIYDGKEFHLGTSAMFEYPRKITSMAINGEAEISQAAKIIGLTEKSKVGNEEGMIGILSKGRWDRKSLTAQAIITALIHLENKELY